MLSYLQKYKELPAEMKRKASSAEVMQALRQMERNYDISLASIVMRVMVKELSVVDLPRYFVFEHGMTGKQAQKLTEELKEKVFNRMSDYIDVPEERAEEVDDSESGAEGKAGSGAGQSSVYSSNFFFSPEDEEEVKELAQKVDDGEQPAQEKKQKQEDVIGQKVQKVLEETGLQMSSRELESRLRQVLNTYIRGVRNKINAKEAMAKPAESGGLDLEAKTIDHIIETADKVKKEPEKQAAPDQGAGAGQGTSQPAGDKEKLEKLRQGYGERDFDYDLSQLRQKGKQESKSGSAGKSAQAESPASGQKPQEERPAEPSGRPGQATGQAGTGADKAEAEKQRAKSQVKEEKVDLGKSKSKAPSSGSGIAKARQAAQAGSKKRMDDVKYKPKLTGPVDELKELTLTDFHRLGEDPQTATQKISDKIEYLAGESYSKKTAGIKAWRQSPVNRLYLEMGQESVTEHKKIDEIIEKRKQEGSDYLTKSEFMSIMELNRNLRY